MSMNSLLLPLCSEIIISALRLEKFMFYEISTEFFGHDQNNHILHGLQHFIICYSSFTIKITVIPGMSKIISGE